MAKYKKYISYLLYIASVLTIICVGLDTVIISEKYIEPEKEVNVYGLIYYFQFLFISIILWGFSFWLNPDKKLSIIYGVIAIVFTVLVVI